MRRRDLLKSLIAAPLVLLGWKPAKAEPITAHGVQIPQVYRTKQAGWWSDKNTWVSGQVPTGHRDTIIVRSPVLLDSKVISCTILLDDSGTLKMSQRESVMLDCVVLGGSGWHGGAMLRSGGMSRGTVNFCHFDAYKRV